MNTIAVTLDSLFLDPNNYRLRGDQNYKFVEEKNISNEMVQKRIVKMIKGDNSTNIKDLLESFKENGYLKIDNIIVKPLKDVEDKYVVVEGNRRVTTLKVLKELYEDGMEIGNVDPDIFTRMEVVVYDVSDKGYEILMGLRHVSGIKEWGDYEQSELISNLVRKYSMTAKDISESLGIGTQTVKRRLNTYFALEIFREDPDYGEYFVPNKLSAIFYEIMGKVNIRDKWLKWNYELNTFENKENMRRLFSWLVPIEDEENGGTKDPIITKRDEIRHLDKFVLDEEAVNKLEESRSLIDALGESQYYSKEGFKNSLKQITGILSKLNLGALTEIDEDDKELITKMLTKMDAQRALIEKIIN